MNSSLPHEPANAGVFRGLCTFFRLLMRGLGFQGVALFAVCLMLMTRPVRAQVIDTHTVWPSGAWYQLYPFGEGHYSTIGQTFKLPDGFNQLDSFTFWYRHMGGADDFDFSTYVFEWDVAAKRAVGPALYESGHDKVAPGANYDDHTYFTGGLVLDAAKQYVMFISSAGYDDGQAGYAGVGYAISHYGDPVDPYAAGEAWWQSSSNDATAFTTGNWAKMDGGHDLAFVATFSAVPEPSTYGFVSAVMLAIIMALRRRRRR